MSAGPSSRRTWLLVGGVAVVALAVFTRRPPQPEAVPLPAAASAFPTRLSPGELSASEANRPADSLPGSYLRPVERPKPVRGPAETAEDAALDSRDPPAGVPQSQRRDAKRTLPEIFRMPVDPPSPVPTATRPKPAVPPAPRALAPFGRLVKCILVNTLDSVTMRAEPIVGLVTEDLAWNGQVVIPADTEVYSYALPAAVIDTAGVGRLVDNGEWTLVLPGDGPANGRELILKGRAVDRRERSLGATGEPASWAIDDGADGLMGYTLSTVDAEDVKLFAAAAVSGLAQGFSQTLQTQETAPGLSGVLGATQAAPTLGNAVTSAAGQGAVAAMNQMAARIQQEIGKRGVYVRVPAGKEFYLFVEQSIDPERAGVGLRLPPPTVFPP